MDWKNVRGTQPEKPDVVEIGSEFVFLRKNIHQFNEKDEYENTITGWEYEELLLTKNEYDDYIKITGNPFYIDDTSDLKGRLTNLETFIATSTQE